MSSGVKFTPHSAALVKKAFNMGLIAAQEQILTDCNCYVKVDQGQLRDSAQHSVGDLKLTVSWNTPYARRQWYTGTPSKDKNPNASMKWAEVAQKEHNKDWIKHIEKGMKNGL